MKKNNKKQAVKTKVAETKKSSKKSIILILMLAVVIAGGALYALSSSKEEISVAEEVDEASKNKKAGEDFLDANAKKEGVVALPSGLQYKVITMGTGEKPKATDKVKAHYRGTLITGEEFDSSRKHGDEPIEFALSGVIGGWTEVLQLMPVGSKWEVYIPQYLAYGERGSAGIPPYSALVFTIELEEIVK